MPVWVMLCTSCTLAFSSLQQDIPHWCHIRAVVRICSHKSCVSLTVDADQDIGCSAARCDAVPRIIPTPQPPHALKQRCTSELNVAAFHLLLCIVLDNLFQKEGDVAKRMVSGGSAISDSKHLCSTRGVRLYGMRVTRAKLAYIHRSRCRRRC